MTTFFTTQFTVLRGSLTAFVMLTFILAGFAAQPALAAAETTLYGPFNDGCYYVWDGVQYIEGQCPQPDGSIDYYVPSANGWVYGMNQWTDAGSVTYTTFADGTYVVQYPDGSTFLNLADGTYGIFAADGTLIEHGYVDSQGLMVPTSKSGDVMSDIPASGTWDPNAPTILDIPDVTAGNCIWMAPSNVDWNDNYDINFSDQQAYCD